MSDELRLNKLQRFQKRSTRLALEAHSHCEVPAGCGGVVLRWRQADATAGVAGSFYCEEPRGPVTVDGEPFDDRRTQLAPGPHVLALTAPVPDPAAGFLLLVLRFSPVVLTVPSRVFTSHSAAAFRASVEPATDDAWRARDFDDASWLALVPGAVPRPKGNRSFSWEYLQREAGGLALPAHAASEPARSLLERLRGRAAREPLVARVRARFSLTPTGFAAP